MVWLMFYRPEPDSYPSADILEGNTGELELVDPTPYGGTALVNSRSFSGRRVKPESVPKVIRRNSKRKILDCETVDSMIVSDRFRLILNENDGCKQGAA